MMLLADQDVYAVTVRFLRAQGWSVRTVAEVGLHAATDEELLHYASTHTMIVLTRDRHFGQLVFIRRLLGGVIYLRITPSTIAAVHEQLCNVLQQTTAEQLHRSFIVVTPGAIRRRHIH